MKTLASIVLLALMIAFPGISYEQSGGTARSSRALTSSRDLTPSRELTPVRGNCKILAALSPAPRASGVEMDKLKFPFDQAWADKVLADKPVYLQNVLVSDFKLPDPPANSSAQTRAELDYLLALQHSRSAEDVRYSLYLSNTHETPSDIGRWVGYWVTPQSLPATDSLLEKVSQDGNYFLWSLKFKYARVRPYVLEPKIHDLEESLAASFPSGHATFAYIYAFIYQEIAPEFTDLFITKAYEVSHAREIIGVHYPSDLEGSRIFARQFINKLLENEKFREDLENVKKEWASKKNR
jgi:acid phosphatase (class A)